ncbi:MAG: hypothetical protein AAGA42_22455, partial [Actinomycetota bacterium]
DAATPELLDDQAVLASIDAAVKFGHDARIRIADAKDELAAYASDGPVALWGAGSKGMTYLNLVAEESPVAAVVDINPRKAGAGVPGTSLTISGPEALVAIKPTTVLVANPIYVAEIADTLTELGVRAETLPLWDERT